MDKIIQRLEIAVMIACVIGTIGFMYLFINVNILKEADNIVSGPIIKLEAENGSGDTWNYEVSEDKIIKIEKHSEILKDDAQNITVYRYSIVPESEGEVVLTFRMTNDKTKDIKDQKSYNIKVTKFGANSYSANIIE